MAKIEGKTKVGEKFRAIPNAGEHAEKVTHAHFASGNVKCTATLETLPQFLKRLNAAIIQPANCIPGHLAQKNENLWFTRKLVHRFS